MLVRGILFLQIFNVAFLRVTISVQSLDFFGHFLQSLGKGLFVLVFLVEGVFCFFELIMEDLIGTGGGVKELGLIFI